MRIYFSITVSLICFGCKNPDSSDRTDENETDRIDDRPPDDNNGGKGDTVKSPLPLKGILKMGPKEGRRKSLKFAPYADFKTIQLIPTNDENKANAEDNSSIDALIKPKVNLEAVKILSQISKDLKEPTRADYPGHDFCGWGKDTLIHIDEFNAKIRFDKHVTLPNSDDTGFRGDNPKGGLSLILQVGRKRRTLYQDLIQKEFKQVPDLGEYIVGMYTMRFSSEEMKAKCEAFFHIEEEYGRTLSSFTGSFHLIRIALIAVRSLTILKAFHSVGFVDGDLTNDLVWTNNNPETLKLRSFQNAELFVNPKTGYHRSVENCITSLIVKEKIGVEDCPSKAVDLIHISNIFNELLKNSNNIVFFEFHEAASDLGSNVSLKYLLFRTICIMYILILAFMCTFNRSSYNEIYLHNPVRDRCGIFAVLRDSIFSSNRAASQNSSATYLYFGKSWWFFASKSGKLS